MVTKIMTISYRIAMPGQTAWDTVSGPGAKQKAIRIAKMARRRLGMHYRVWRIDEDGKTNEVDVV